MECATKSICSISIRVALAWSVWARLATVKPPETLLAWFLSTRARIFRLGALMGTFRVRIGESSGVTRMKPGANGAGTPNPP